MKEIKTKEDVFKAICNASRLGNLGFFVGSGFTKAILENNTYYEAYTWAELLKVCCEEMKINENILKNKKARRMTNFLFLAETVGFEPTVRYKPHN